MKQRGSPLIQTVIPGTSIQASCDTSYPMVPLFITVTPDIINSLKNVQSAVEERG